MYKPFESMPSDARLWVYQSNRKFTQAEKTVLHQGLTKLCSEWSAHGSPLQTSFAIEYDQFVVLAVDENFQGASGCSIDGSVHFLQQIQQQLELDFFSRGLVAFKGGDVVLTYPYLEIKTLLANKTLSPETLSFDNTVVTKGEWEKRWLVPIKNSWMARFLPKTAIEA